MRTLGETRWGARADALCTFKLSFDVILKALEVLDNIQDSKARGFINSVLKFEFIIALIACEWFLQRVDLDLLQAHTQAKVVIQSLCSERNDESCSLRASSPIWASKESLARTREREVLARLISLAQIGEFARRLRVLE